MHNTSSHNIIANITKGWFDITQQSVNNDYAANVSHTIRSLDSRQSQIQYNTSSLCHTGWVVNEGHKNDNSWQDDRPVDLSDYQSIVIEYTASMISIIAHILLHNGSSIGFSRMSHTHTTCHTNTQIISHWLDISLIEIDTLHHHWSGWHSHKVTIDELKAVIHWYFQYRHYADVTPPSASIDWLFHWLLDDSFFALRSLLAITNSAAAFAMPLQRPASFADVRLQPCPPLTDITLITDYLFHDIIIYFHNIIGHTIFLQLDQ